jgi:cation transport ATPase
MQQRKTNAYRRRKHTTTHGRQIQKNKTDTYKNTQDQHIQKTQDRKIQKHKTDRHNKNRTDRFKNTRQTDAKTQDRPTHTKHKTERYNKNTGPTHTTTQDRLCFCLARSCVFVSVWLAFSYWSVIFLHRSVLCFRIYLSSVSVGLAVLYPGLMLLYVSVLRICWSCVFVLVDRIFVSVGLAFLYWSVVILYRSVLRFCTRRCCVFVCGLVFLHPSVLCFCIGRSCVFVLDRS